MPKVWVTKYALTRGLIEMDAKLVSGQNGVVYADGRFDGGQLFTREYALTRAEAFQIVDKLRIRKIAVLKKQIDKLEKLQIPILTDAELVADSH